ncbi:acetyl-CoA C-acetyltransferase [Pelagibacteraceae bacterium]|nr:acetyl-CoA C-acetyltransferase [Pelagibacteraceae bacterium]
MKKKEIIITSAVRTAVGSLGKSLKNASSEILGSKVMSEAIRLSKINKNEVDEVIFGQVLTGGSGQNPARQAAMKAGIPKEIPAYVVNQVCGSGIRSVASAFQSIKAEDSKIIIAGGQENMSLAQHTIHLRSEKKLGNAELIDSMIKDGLWDAFNDYHMGVTAENVADKFQISRIDQDKFALRSQEKAIKAQKEKKFEEEIINFIIKSNNSEINFNHDEHPREGISLQTLSKLKSVFKKNGTVTAGNSSGINDGAAAVTVMAEIEAEKRNLNKLVSIKSWASCGVDPALMGTGPIPSTKKALDIAGWSIKDVDLFEINEAFAAQSIAVLKTLSIPDEKVNVNGGAIALGHPIGASGTRILVTLIHEMIKRDVKKGLATLCIGGGMGIAMCVER